MQGKWHSKEAVRGSAFGMWATTNCQLISQVSLERVGKIQEFLCSDGWRSKISRIPAHCISRRRKAESFLNAKAKSQQRAEQLKIWPSPSEEKGMAHYVRNCSYTCGVQRKYKTGVGEGEWSFGVDAAKVNLIKEKLDSFRCYAWFGDLSKVKAMQFI